MGKDDNWTQDMNKFKAWANGSTGVPFVDANMRELKAGSYRTRRCYDKSTTSYNMLDFKSDIKNL